MHPPLALPQKQAQALNDALNRLKETLTDRLLSVAIYGGAVREPELARDLNLMIVVQRANPETLQIIGDIVKTFPAISPFVLEADGLEGDFRAFAPKFASIQRNYHLLHGEDILASFKMVPALERFLIEQALRNLRLRLGQAYLGTTQGKKGFDQYLVSLAPTVFTQLSSVLRNNGIAVPSAYRERTVVLEKIFGAGNGVLSDLLALKEKPRKLKPAQASDYFDRLHRLLSASLNWMEEKWPLQLSA